MPTQTYRCPHCRERIDSLDYNCSYTEWGTESGSYSLTDGYGDSNNRDCSNSESEDWEYQCPECGADVDDPSDCEGNEEEDEEETVSLLERPGANPIIRPMPPHKGLYAFCRVCHDLKSTTDLKKEVCQMCLTD